jgi:serine/threonine-protein kinase HipA
MAMQPQNPPRHAPLRQLFVHVWVDGKAHVAGVIETSGDYWPPARRSSSFRYGRSWLERPGAFPIDPVNLPLLQGPQPAPDQWQLHGAFEDTCPDGWGQLVINLRYPDDNFGKIEYIAATSDDRVGFLGYSSAPALSPQEMDAYGRLVAPTPTMPLAQLVEAAKLIENNEKLPTALEPYFQRGSSLGGARPKAAFTDDDGSLWIAKFGMSDDKFNNARVEAACLDMAEAVGIKTPEHRVQMVGADTVLLVRRFDRITSEDGSMQKLGYLSAKTVLGADDLYRTEFSYADLAAAARKLGTPAADDVFRRMLLNVYAGNTDEHLKNHAFLRGIDGRWGVSPVFDIVPCPSKRNTVMRLGKGHAVDVDDAFSSHAAMGLRQDEAEAIRTQVEEVARRWREFMADRGVSDEDIEAITPAFY